MKWIPAKEVSPSPELIDFCNGNRLMADVLVRRGITTVEDAKFFIDPEVYEPASSYEMPGLVEAVDIITEAIAENKRIGVWGDFDVDGQTSTTLLVSAFKTLEADVVYHIPIRATESHGVNIPNLDKLIAKGIDLLVTCDTGISANEAIEHAKLRGLQIVITDHHDLPEILPAADAIVNSKLMPDGHPLSTLAGVGVAYKLVEALFRETGKEEQLEDLLDLVALGMVADIALLTGDARYLVQRGLKVLQKTTRLGLKELMRLAELEPSHITEEHIGFTIAPRLNALGRLGDANIIVEFLTTNDLARAAVIANQLDGLNSKRKLLTDQVFDGALAQIEQNPDLLDKYAALVLSNPAWPGGVIGIVASRLVERYNKPTILLKAPPEELARGSARSIDGCNITKAITENKHLLEGFGGHPMAAGMSLKSENIYAFRKALSKSVTNQLGKEAIEQQMSIDLEIPLDHLTEDFISDVEQLAPFGAGNPGLVYVARNLKLKSKREIGRTRDHLALVVEDEQGNDQRVFWWNGARWDIPNGKFDLAFSARMGSYRGNQEIQAAVIDFQITEELEEKISEYSFIDYRNVANPEKELEDIREKEVELAVWAEADHKKTVNGLYRHEVKSAEALIIWTTPPSFSVMKDVIERVNPTRIYLFDNRTDMNTMKALIQRVLGLVKFSLENKEGKSVV